MTVVLPDFMPDLRQWCRNHPDLAPLHSGRVFFRIPTTASGYPLMRLYRAGGGVIDDYTPLFRPRIAFEVWGNDDRMYDKVRQLEIAVESAIWGIEAGRLFPGSSTYAISGIVTAAPDVPDPQTGWPRFVVDATLVLRLAGTADP